MFDALIKIGGSLYADAHLHTYATAWAALAAKHRLLVLPGGGSFADQVRAADQRFSLSDSTAHWMAILAMDQYAYLLADLVPGAVVAHDLAAAATACAAGRLAILAPSTLLRATDPLPHSWQVTSDSIAAWLAWAEEIELLVLLKHVDGGRGDDQQAAILQREVSLQSLTRSDIVDSYFPTALSPRTICWIIDGRRPERLAKLLSKGSTLGMRVAQQ